MKIMTRPYNDLFAAPAGSYFIYWEQMPRLDGGTSYRLNTMKPTAAEPAPALSDLFLQTSVNPHFTASNPEQILFRVNAARNEIARSCRRHAGNVVILPEKLLKTYLQEEKKLKKGYYEPCHVVGLDIPENEVWATYFRVLPPQESGIAAVDGGVYTVGGKAYLNPNWKSYFIRMQAYD